jgi:hypothetical protein
VDVALITAFPVPKTSTTFYRVDAGIMVKHASPGGGGGRCEGVSPIFLLHCVGRDLGRVGTTSKESYRISINKLPQSRIPGIALGSSTV